jgi:hypothetical protein
MINKSDISDIIYPLGKQGPYFKYVTFPIYHDMLYLCSYCEELSSDWIDYLCSVCYNGLSQWNTESPNPQE